MFRPASLAAILGFLVVALGAFGAHALEARLSAEALEWWNTATIYGLAHTLAALLMARTGEDRAASIATGAFLVGSVVFCGSLYAMALGAPRWFGAITPIGGVSFLFGWGAAAMSAKSIQ